MAPCLCGAAFLEAPASEQLFKAMAAIRCHPAPDIRAEGALFWRILLDTREVALPWAQSLQLQEASCLVRSCLHMDQRCSLCVPSPLSDDIFCHVLLPSSC